MKVYILYVLSDYATAIHMSVDKSLCEKELEECVKRGVTRPLWIEEYDFSQSKEYELECD